MLEDATVKEQLSKNARQRDQLEKNLKEYETSALLPNFFSPRLPQLRAIPRVAPCDMLFSVEHSYRMLIGACYRMACPIHVLRYKTNMVKESIRMG